MFFHFPTRKHKAITEGLSPDRIDIPNDPVIEEEYAYPFPAELPEPGCLLKKEPDTVELVTIRENFTINIMQSGCGRRYVDAFIEQKQSFDIPVRIVGEERYPLCDTKIPE